MRIFVTAGNTQVPIDQVRCITNIFTGRTGAAIALEAYRRGHVVTLATSHPDTVQNAVASLDQDRWYLQTYRTFADLEQLMGMCITGTHPDAVVHCAAVSDYLAAGIYAPAPSTRFDADDLCWRTPLMETPAMRDRSAAKVKSDESELWLRLIRAPKLVDRIRTDWGHAGILVKFKLEAGVSKETLLAIAERSRRQSSADWMVANTLEDAQAWALLGNADGYRQATRAELPGALLDVLETQYREMHHV